MRAIHALAAIAALVMAACDQTAGLTFCAVAIDDSPVRGRDDALVTMVEFADYQCPYCRQAAGTVAEVEADHGDDLRLVFKHLPISSHDRAMPAAVAAQCAHEQGRFWEMNDLLNDDAHAELDELALVDAATQAGLDVDAWRECRLAGEAQARVETDLQLAEDIGIPATPTFLVNGYPLIGSQSYEEYVDAIDSALDDAEASGLDRDAYYDSLVERGCE
jgi:protein-disulfide isomerase